MLGALSANGGEPMCANMTRSELEALLHSLAPHHNHSYYQLPHKQAMIARHLSKNRSDSGVAIIYEGRYGDRECNHYKNLEAARHLRERYGYIFTHSVIYCFFVLDYLATLTSNAVDSVITR